MHNSGDRGNWAEFFLQLFLAASKAAPRNRRARLLPQYFGLVGWWRGSQVNGLAITLAGAVIMDSQFHYLPLTPGLFSILVFLAVGLVILIQLRILRYAYMRLGVGPGVALLLLFGSLIGSYFNIPITILPGKTVRSGEIVDFFGMRYVVPIITSSGTVLAVNVGGAVIPTLMSTYLMLR